MPTCVPGISAWQHAAQASTAPADVTDREDADAHGHFYDFLKDGLNMLLRSTTLQVLPGPHLGPFCLPESMRSQPKKEGQRS
jgi:hypothetical protein